MREPPGLDADWWPTTVRSRYALLINPFYPKDPHASFGKHVLTPTLALTSIAASMPASWTVSYWDENLLQGPPPSEPFPRVVGITVHLTFANRAYELSRWYRDRGAKVVFGGLHVLSCPEECRPHADALALGEGVQLWGQILRDVDADALQPEYRGSFRRPYSEDPPPRRDLVPSGEFLTSASMIATRGCHSRCRFCYLATEGLRMPYHRRDASQIAQEFADTGQDYGVFIDNNLGSDRTYLRELCRHLRPLRKIWSAAVSINVTDDPDAVRDMARAGCTGVFVGFESLRAGNITDARKRSPLPEDYARRVRLLHDHGIQVNGSFVLGFDHDDRDVFVRTADWIETNRLECATFHILTPYPGTPLFREMERQGRLLHRDWSKYDTAHVVFRPRKMSPDELAAGYRWCYERLFSMSSIWRSRPSDAGAVLPYLAMSLLYKRSNWLWYVLIRHRLTGAIWRPMIRQSLRRHLRLRDRMDAEPSRAAAVVSAGV